MKNWCDRDAGEGPVQAVNITVVVDGEQRSVWRRRSEVMKWYVPVGVISPRESVTGPRRTSFQTANGSRRDSKTASISDYGTILLMVGVFIPAG